MESVPLVSVLMPVYNGEKYLHQAIDSILGQTFKNFEFIILNDGSTDRSEEVIKSYSDPRIRYVKNEKNIRLIATLNKGLGLCTGKYIARMDADDVSFPDRFKYQVEFMESHPEYGLCGSDIEINGDYKSWVRIGESEYIRFCLLFHNPVCHPTAFIRTSVIRDHGLEYPSEYVHAEEYILWLNLLRFSKVINLDKKLLNYRLHEGQVSSVFKDDQFRMGQRIRLELFREIVLASSPGARKVHLAVAGMVTRGLQKSGFDQVEIRFNADYTRPEINSWLRCVKTGLLFRKKWDSIYLRELIRKVESAKRDMPKWGTRFRHSLSRFRKQLSGK